jgi:hypothetical protein
MTKHWRVGGMVIVVGLTVVMLGVPSGQGADDTKEVREAVEKFVDFMSNKDNKPDEVTKQAKAIAKNFDLEQVMKLMEPRDQGGFGIGGKAGAIKPDGIENKLKELAEKPELKVDDYKLQAEAIKRMALQSAALSEVAQHLGPTKNMAPRWKGFSDDMKKTALKLAEANKPSEVKAAAALLNKACVDCHNVFK